MKISASEFSTLGMHDSAHACMNFVLRSTEAVVQGVHKVVIWLSFGVIWRHKASGGIRTLCRCDARSYTDLKQQLKGRGVSPNDYNHK